MKNSMVVTLTLTELATILYAHFLKEGVVAHRDDFTRMKFYKGYGNLDGTEKEVVARKEFFVTLINDNEKESHWHNKAGRMIRIEDEK